MNYSRCKIGSAEVSSSLHEKSNLAIKTETAPKKLSPLQWSKNLVGKKLEIYWTPSNKKINENAKNFNEKIFVEVSSSGDEQTKVPSDTDDDSEKSELLPDWYDARIEAFDKQSKMFTVRFVGEEENVYNMGLSPTLVRPSIRAWEKRTLAILNWAEESNWINELVLRTSTAMLEDEIYLNQMLEKNRLSYCSESLHYPFERAESMVTSKVAGIKKGNSANQGMTISDGKINAMEQQSYTFSHIFSANDICNVGNNSLGFVSKRQLNFFRTIPPKWTMKVSQRKVGSKIDTKWFSPVMNHEFRTMIDVKRFLTLLKLEEGDEDAAFAKLTNKCEKSFIKFPHSNEERILFLRLLGEQIYLRAKLVVVSEGCDNDENGEEEKDMPVTEKYVDHLFACLRIVKDALLWYQVDAWNIWKCLGILSSSSATDHSFHIGDVISSGKFRKGTNFPNINVHHKLATEPIDYQHSIPPIVSTQHIHPNAKNVYPFHIVKAQSPYSNLMQERNVHSKTDIDFKQHYQNQPFHLKKNITALTPVNSSHPYEIRSTASLSTETASATNHGALKPNILRTNSFTNSNDTRTNFQTESKIKVQVIEKCLLSGIQHILNILLMETSPIACPETVYSSSLSQRSGLKSGHQQISDVEFSQQVRSSVSPFASFAEIKKFKETLDLKLLKKYEGEDEFEIRSDLKALKENLKPLFAICRLNKKIRYVLPLVECVKHTFDIWFHVIHFLDTSKDIIYQNRVSVGCQTDKVRYINETHNEHFTFRDLQKFLESSLKCPILSRVDLSFYQTTLVAKVQDVLSFVANAWQTIAQCTNEINITTDIFKRDVKPNILEKNDTVLKSLLAIKSKLTNDSSIKNINPIGDKESPLRHQVIDDAIVVRRWVVDLAYVQRNRERQIYVSNVIEHGKSGLPNLPEIPIQYMSRSKYSLMSPTIAHVIRTRISNLSSSMISCGRVVLESEELLEKRYSNESRLELISDVHEGLQKMKKLQFIFLTEEKLAVRADILGWKEIVLSTFKAYLKLPMETVQSFKQNLQNIKLGKSSARSNIVTGVSQNLDIDEQICEFANKDIQKICSYEVNELNNIHEISQKWKIKASSIILLLQEHANVRCSTGSDDHSMQIKNFKKVHIHDMKKVIEDYANCRILLPQYDALCNIHSFVIKWMEELSTIVNNLSLTPSQCLSCLKQKRDEQPQG